MHFYCHSLCVLYILVSPVSYLPWLVATSFWLLLNMHGDTASRGFICVYILDEHSLEAPQSSAHAIAKMWFLYNKKQLSNMLLASKNSVARALTWGHSKVSKLHNFHWMRFLECATVARYTCKLMWYMLNFKACTIWMFPSAYLKINRQMANGEAWFRRSCEWCRIGKWVQVGILSACKAHRSSQDQQ